MGALPEADFHFIARETKARTGMMLAPEKAHLLETRLTPVARREGFLSVQEMITTARARQDDRLLWALADALTVHETSFFRDRKPFFALRDTILPALAQARDRNQKLRILCAGCSSGQEPYSLAMMLDEMRHAGRGLDCEIVAIDVSERGLEKARIGAYSQFEVQRGLPIALLVRYFEKTGDLWRVCDRVRASVQFHRANLTLDLSRLHRFDVILCRNVLTYFDDAARTRALDQLADMLEPDGSLFLGSGESAGRAFAPSGRTGAFAPLGRTRVAA